MSRIDYQGRTALVTGASAGLGVEFARQLAARGSDLVLVARRKGRLEALASELTERYGTRVRVHAADLTAPEAVSELVTDLHSQGIRISTLVNNAGFATYGLFADEDPDRILAELNLNIVALVCLTRQLMPTLLAEGNGSLINLASTASFQAVPRAAVYSASKAFVRQFTEALWYEAKGSGLKVISISPGPTRTEFFDVAGSTALAIGRMQGPAPVVRTTLRSLDRRSSPPGVVSGLGNRFIAFGGRFMPRRALIAFSGALAGQPK